MIPTDTRKPFDVREIIARIVDGSEFDEFKARYGTTLVCGFARIEGMQVGIIANNGILFSESALKGAHFIELCCQRKIPLVFLQNITGFMVGRKYENEGIARNGAKMVTAVATAQRAQIHHHHRRQLWRRQLRHVRPRLQPALFVDVAQRPHHASMGGEQAASVLATVKRDGIEAKGGSWSADGRRSLQSPHPPAVRRPGPPLLRQRPPVGRRRDRPRRHPPRAGAGPGGHAAMRRSKTPNSASSACNARRQPQGRPPMSKPVTLTVNAGVATITLSAAGNPQRLQRRGDCRNHRRLRNRVAQHAEVRAVVLAAEGPAFCAGANLNWMRRMADYSPRRKPGRRRQAGRHDAHHLHLPPPHHRPRAGRCVRRWHGPGGRLRHGRGRRQRPVLPERR